jgi:integrase
MLSAKAVEHAKPTSTRREIADGLLSGLYLIVQRSGVKSWAVRYRYGGRSKKLTLGRYPAMDVAKARQAGRDALTVAAAGNDPAQQKRIIRKHAAEGRDLVETVVAEFLERHAKAKRSYRELKRMLDREVVPHWRGRKIQDISRRDVIELLDGLMDRGVGRMTNMVFSVVRKLFRWAVERDIVAASPCTGMRPPAPEVSRDRVLADDELRRLWQAADGLGYPFGPMFKLLALTGQRLGEVAGMAWPEIDLEKKLWSLPRQRVKNARAHDVPLSDLAIEILASLPRIGSPKEFVFTTTGETPASGFSRAKRNLDAAMLAAASDASPTIAPFTLHDVRRTVATGMQRLGIAPHVTEAVLNHRSGTIKGVAAVYARYDYASEKRSALESWSSHLSSVLSDYASGTDDGAFRGGHTSS